MVEGYPPFGGGCIFCKYWIVFPYLLLSTDLLPGSKIWLAISIQLPPKKLLEPTVLPSVPYIKNGGQHEFSETPTQKFQDTFLRGSSATHDDGTVGSESCFEAKKIYCCNGSSCLSSATWVYISYQKVNTVIILNQYICFIKWKI